jgi:hypothetical protein
MEIKLKDLYKLKLLPEKNIVLLYNSVEYVITEDLYLKHENDTVVGLESDKEGNLIISISK